MVRRIILFVLIINFIIKSLNAQTNEVIKFSQRIDTSLFPIALNRAHFEHFSFKLIGYKNNKIAYTKTLSDTNKLANYIGRNNDTLHFELKILMKAGNIDSYSIYGIGSLLYSKPGGERNLKVFKFKIDKEIPPLRIRLTTEPENLVAYYFTTKEWNESFPLIFKQENKMELEKHRFGNGYSPGEMAVEAYTYMLCVFYKGKLYVRSAEPDFDNPTSVVEFDMEKEKPIQW